MFKNLKERWQVNGTNLILIICTFALGGSLCGFACRKLLEFTGMDRGFAWVLLYILLVTLLWPFCVLLISFPFGQFFFFIKYLTKIWKRMSGQNKTSVSVAIFASGAGSNAEKIIEQTLSSPNGKNGSFKINLIVCNKPDAGVLNIALKHDIETLLIEKEQFFKGDSYIPILKEKGIQFIILAGFLWKVPVSLIRAYPNKIVNIHPALLPKYGGKGMYGDKVHQAIIAAGEKESGITIHYVDELYDHGSIIFQANCDINENDTPDSLAKKVHSLEHRHYPEVIEGLLKDAK
jgi:formyltetrahydrofolate-dependent phosphoribosylglycinamide formyltransferase